MIIYVPEDIMARLESQLHAVPEKIPDVLRKTINSTARYGKKSVVRHTKERYVLKKAASRINSASEFESARGKNFQATIMIKGRPEPLMDFKVRKNGKKVSASAKVLKTSPLERLTLKGGDKNGKDLKAFVVGITNVSNKIDMSTGTNGISHHVGVFQRYPEGKRKGKSRNAIKQLYSTSIPQMVKNDKVYPKIEYDIKEELRRNLEKHIATVMEGL